MKDIRQIAESYIKKNPASVGQWPQKNIEELAHELQVHEIELEMQNDELRSSQRELEDAYSQYANLFDFAPVSYFVLDRNSLILNLNLTACSQLGVDRKQILKKNFTQFVSKKSRSYFLLHRDQAMQSSEIEKGEIEIMRQNGQTFLAQAEIVAIRDSSGSFEHYRMSLIDVTQHHLALKRERELNQLKSEFVTMASHEFRNPLSIILNSATLLGKFTLEDQQPDRALQIDRIKSSVRNLTEILQDCLSLEKIESGQVTLEPGFFELAPFVEHLMGELEGIKRAGQVITYLPEVSSVQKVYLDKKLLRNILMNLVSNACKYSPEGALIEVTSLVTENLVCLSVRDHGMGISQTEQKSLFSRFFRGQHVLNIPGTGLGLSLVKKYLLLMGGRIHFESKLGEGSTFSIEFPN